MNEKKNITVKNTVLSCGADKLLPFVLVYIFYVILHGHLSPGGGFQGGVLMVAVVVLLDMGHGYQTAARSVNRELMHKGEGLMSIVYIALAMIGVAYGANFCMNAIYDVGDIGDFISTGTIGLMNVTVGLKVLTGVGVLALSMLGLVFGDEKE